MEEKVQVNMRIGKKAGDLFDQLCLRTFRGKSDMMEFLVFQEAKKEGLVNALVEIVDCSQDQDTTQISV